MSVRFWIKINFCFTSVGVTGSPGRTVINSVDADGSTHIRRAYTLEWVKIGGWLE